MNTAQPMTTERYRLALEAIASMGAGDEQTDHAQLSTLMRVVAQITLSMPAHQVPIK